MILSATQVQQDMGGLWSQQAAPGASPAVVLDTPAVETTPTTATAYILTVTCSALGSEPDSDFINTSRSIVVSERITSATFCDEIEAALRLVLDAVSVRRGNASASPVCEQISLSTSAIDGTVDSARVAGALAAAAIALEAQAPFTAARTPVTVRYLHANLLGISDSSRAAICRFAARFCSLYRVAFVTVDDAGAGYGSLHSLCLDYHRKADDGNDRSDGSSPTAADSDAAVIDTTQTGAPKRALRADDPADEDTPSDVRDRVMSRGEALLHSVEPRGYGSFYGGGGFARAYYNPVTKIVHRYYLFSGDEYGVFDEVEAYARMDEYLTRAERAKFAQFHGCTVYCSHTDIQELPATISRLRLEYRAQPCYILETRMSQGGESLWNTDVRSMERGEQEKIFDGVMDCIGLLRKCGIVHQDPYPRNIIYRKDAGVRIIDFGDVLFSTDRAYTAACDMGVDYLEAMAGLAGANNIRKGGMREIYRDRLSTVEFAPEGRWMRDEIEGIVGPGMINRWVDNVRPNGPREIQARVAIDILFVLLMRCRYPEIYFTGLGLDPGDACDKIDQRFVDRRSLVPVDIILYRGLAKLRQFTVARFRSVPPQIKQGRVVMKRSVLGDVFVYQMSHPYWIADKDEGYLEFWNDVVTRLELQTSSGQTARQSDLCMAVLQRNPASGRATTHKWTAHVITTRHGAEGARVLRDMTAAERAVLWPIDDDRMRAILEPLEHLADFEIVHREINDATLIITGDRCAVLGLGRAARRFMTRRGVARADDTQRALIYHADTWQLFFVLSQMARTGRKFDESALTDARAELFFAFCRAHSLTDPAIRDIADAIYAMAPPTSRADRPDTIQAVLSNEDTTADYRRLKHMVGDVVMRMRHPDVYDRYIPGSKDSPFFTTRAVFEATVRPFVVIPIASQLRR
jgi:hypothetical protein